jgi:hypothetical protein
VYRIDPPHGKAYDIETYHGPGIYSVKDGPLVAVGATEVLALTTVTFSGENIFSGALSHLSQSLKTAGLSTEAIVVAPFVSFG